MLRRLLWAVLALNFIGLTDCGPRPKNKGPSGTVTAEKTAPKENGPQASAQPQPDPTPQVPISPITEEEGGTVAPLLTQEERKTEIPAYVMPAPLRERLRKDLPEFVMPSQSTAFQVTDHNLNVNVKNSTMTFTGTLKITGRPDEKLELRCQFDKSKDWTCSNMFPTDPKVAAERRLQATANCLDVYRCDQLGVELFVRINGRIESQMFQTTKFSVHRASSGDEAAAPPVPKPRPVVPKDEELSPEELSRILDDSNVAVEITGPIPMPNPGEGEFSIPEIEKLRPAIGAGVPVQAVRFHYRGELRNAAELPKQGPGFAVRSGPDRRFGTNMMVDLIQQAAAVMEKSKPNLPVVMVADISQKYGGRLSNRSGRFHASHQTGLDADIAFPSHRNVEDLWPASTRGKISNNLDEERFWTFLSAMTCAEDNPVIAVFVDASIKEHMCNWAKERWNIDDPNSCAFKTLRSMKHEASHHDHMHVRLRCPGNPECRDATVTLGRTTGC